MSGHGHGFGYGLKPPSGGGGGGPVPGDLSNMVVHLSVDGSMPTALAAHTPGTPYWMQGAQTLTNLAAGGPSLAFSRDLVQTRPYYHTAPWVLTGEPVTVPQPNGYPFFATNNFDDTKLAGNAIAYTEIDLGAYTTEQVPYSGIMVIHFVQDSAVARRQFENRGGTGEYSYVSFGEDGNVVVDDGATQGLVSTPQSDKWEDQWVVITWTHDPVTGMDTAYNGERLPMTAGAANLTGNMTFDMMFSQSVQTSGFTESILYEAAHSMADLDGPAAALASKYGITYAVS